MLKGGCGKPAELLLLLSFANTTSVILSSKHVIATSYHDQNSSHSPNAGQALARLHISTALVGAMSIDAPAYIVSLQNNIRARPISWEGAVRAKTITDDDLKKIKAIDKVRKEQRKATIEADVQTYTDLLLGNAEGSRSIFENAAKRTDILQYMLVLTGDLIDGRDQNTKSQLVMHCS